MNQHWNIVATGSTGDDSEAITIRLQQLKLSAPAIQSILSGKAITLKKNLDHAKAYAYKRKLESYGLKIKLERYRPIKSSTAKVAEPPKPALTKPLGLTPIASQRPSNSQSFSCPKCGHKQSRTQTCTACGIIFSKWKSPESAPSTTVTTADTRMQRAQQRNTPVSEPTPWFKYASIVAVAVTMYWGKIHFIDRPDLSILGDAPKTVAAAEWTWNNTRHSQPALDLATLVKSGDYNELENNLSNLQSDIINNPVEEYELWSIFWNLLKQEQPVSQDQLQAWVDASGSDWSHVALGVHYYLQGLEARGTCTANCITGEQWESQTKKTRKAVKHLTSGLEINSGNSVALLFLTSISNNVPGVYIDSEDTFEKAITIFPGSFSLRDIQMQNLLPRWGGSYYAMDEFAQSQQRYTDQNPRLYTLQGAVFQDMAWYAKRDKNCDTAIPLFEEALKFGFKGSWAYDYGYCLNSVAATAPKQTPETIAMLERSQDFVELAIKIEDKKVRQQFLDLVKVNIKQAKYNAG